MGQEFPRIKIDLRGMIEYAKIQGKKMAQLTILEKIPKLNSKEKDYVSGPSYPQLK